MQHNTILEWSLFSLIILAGAGLAVIMQCIAKRYLFMLEHDVLPDAACFFAAAGLLPRHYQTSIKQSLSCISSKLSLGQGLIAVLIGVFYLMAFIHYGWSPSFWLVSVLAFFLGCLAFIDAYTGLLPDALTLPLLWAGIISAWLGWPDTTLLVPLHTSLAGVFLAYGLPIFLLLMWRWLKKIDGMGAGDAKLLGALGAWLGVYTVLPLLFLSCILAIIFAMVHQATLFPKGSYRFGPFIVISAGVFLLYPSALQSWFWA